MLVGANELIIIVIAAFAVVLVGLSFLRRSRIFRFLRFLALSTLITVAAFLCLMVWQTLNLFEVSDTEIASVHIDQLGDERFRLTLERQGASEVLVINGDQVQLDIKLVKLSPFLDLFGVDSRFVFDRISGRYARVEQQKANVVESHDLSSQADRYSFWYLSARCHCIPFIDTRYGSSSFVPMVNDARYRYFIGKDGLIVRPGNGVARAALTDWE